MKCGVRGCDRKAIDTFDHWNYELDLCEDGLRHIYATRIMVAFAGGKVVTKKEFQAYLKPEAIERLFSPWERSREKVEESEEESDSDLFVREDIRDKIADHPELKKLSEKGIQWKIKIPANWKGIVHPSNFPDSGTAEVMVGKTVIGVVSWKTEFKIEQGALGKYIEAYPERVEFKRKKGK